MYEIKIKKKNGNMRTIKCSSEHKFFTDKKYIEAKHLKIGDKLKVLINPHTHLDNPMLYEKYRKKVSNRLKGMKNTWWHKNKASFKKGSIPWNKNKTKYDFDQIASHRKGVPMVEEYGVKKANKLRKNLSLSTSRMWNDDQKRNQIIYTRNKNNSLKIEKPWLTYNKNRKIKKQTNKDGDVICEHCNNIILGNKRLHCHHIDKNHKNNSLKNLMILCAKCHTFIHQHKRNKIGRFVK